MVERPHGEGGKQTDRLSDTELLAALERAMRHRLPAPGPASMWMLLEHLAVAPRSAAARELRGRLAALRERGLLACGREHGVVVFSPTAAGVRALRAAGPQRLPESPRHLAWRRAQTAAAQELPRFRTSLAATLERAERMLADSGRPDSGAWLELGRALAGDCNRVGSAWHCLHEWPEPDDASAQPAAAERARLAALRNIRLWREPD